MRPLHVLVAPVLLALAARVAAQNTQVPGSGCANAPFPPAGAARVGQQFTWGSIICTGTSMHLSVLGVQLPTLLPVQPPITCRTAGVCLLACDPLVVVPGAGGSLFVPNDPRLIGACLCLQGLCYDINFNCFIMSGALQVCIQP
jgi:hypothetical protein